ncbi:MAG: M56 family metallopeptidase [Muribaculaceae bacterium]|nr:M56 family metallopeptidase [Muribaculaceae bacterium]
MGEVFAYSLGSSLVLLLLYLVYKWVLASESFHALNRSLLMGIYLISLVALPLYAQVKKGLTYAPPADRFTVDIEGISNTVLTVPEEGPEIQPSIILMIYISGMLFVLTMSVFSIIKTMRIIRRGEVMEYYGRKVVVIKEENTGPFSFGNYIVIPESELREDCDMILLHEHSHIRLHHCLDLLLAQLVIILQWYNPAAWLMRREVKTVHEYQADQRVVNEIPNIRDYQLLLIKKTVGARFPSLANSLYQSKLKKRIVMMCKKQPTRSSRLLRPMLLVPALGAALWLTGVPAVASVMDFFVGSSLTFPVHSAGKVTNFPSDKGKESTENLKAAPSAVAPASSISAAGTVSAVSSDEVRAAKKESDSDEVSSSDPRPHDAVEKTAEFPGGMKALFSYLASNIKSPDDDTPAGLVIVQFVVEANGEIGDAIIKKGLSPAMDAEALRVVKAMPRWIPAEVGGKPVASNYVLPVKYEPVGDNTSIFVLPDGNKQGQKGGGATSSQASSSGSSNIMTSVSTSTNSSGKTETTTVIASEDGDNKMSISVTTDKKSIKDFEVYVDGKRYHGNLNEIPSTKVESMKVEQTDGDTPIIRITLKK